MTYFGIFLALLVLPSEAALVKVKTKKEKKIPEGATVLVTPPHFTSAGLAETLGDAVGVSGVGEALDTAAGSVLHRDGHKRDERFEKAFGKLAKNVAFTVRTGAGRHTALACDYNLVLLDEEGKDGVRMAAYTGTATAAAKAVSGHSKIKSTWVLKRCGDDSEVASGALKYMKNRRLYTGQLRTHHKIKLKSKPLKAVRKDFELDEAVAAREAHAALVADITAWRAAGEGQEPGAGIAGVAPTEDGHFASPVAASGELEKWGLKLLGVSLVEGAAEAVEARVGKLAASGTDMAKAATEKAIAERLPADHHLPSECALASWLDASYAHRDDYGQIVTLATRAYPKLATDYRACLLSEAERRQAEGITPPG